MSEQAVIMNRMGKSVASGELEHLLGTVRTFRDIDYSATGVPANRSGRLVTAIWVKNRSGSTLTKRQCLKLMRFHSRRLEIEHRNYPTQIRHLPRWRYDNRRNIW